VTDLAPDGEAEIAFIRGDQKVVQRLCDLGLTLKTRVKLVRKAPRRGPVELLVRRTTLAIASDIADNIFVTRVEA
jgi:DtxR family Mn-dependent transcriptional regulator